MARRQKKRETEVVQGAWLVTFSDMTTLLLTFFVLLLSMSSMDHTLISRIRLASSGVQLIELSGAGTISPRIGLIKEIIEAPEHALEKKEKLKDLLLPDIPLPAEINTSSIKDNITILQHPEGVVIALTDRLVFQEGSYELTTPARQILGTISELLHFSSADVNIAGHTDNTDYPDMDNYKLSAFRALTVMEYFLQKGHKPDRFSLSAYGPDKPLHPNDNPENKTQNRRVEILLKTTQWVGRYI